MNPFKFDDYLCDKFQQLSDWLQDNTGKTCFWYALSAYVASCAFAFLAIWFAGPVTVSEAIAASVMLAICVSLYFDTIERIKSMTSASKMVANPYRRFWILRVAFMASFAYHIIKLFQFQSDSALMKVFDNALFTVTIYFMCCTPRPWSRNMAGKWLDAIAARLFGIPQT